MKRKRRSSQQDKQDLKKVESPSKIKKETKEPFTNDPLKIKEDDKVSTKDKKNEQQEVVDSDGYVRKVMSITKNNKTYQVGYRIKDPTKNKPKKSSKKIKINRSFLL